MFELQKRLRHRDRCQQGKNSDCSVSDNTDSDQEVDMNIAAINKKRKRLFSRKIPKKKEDKNKVEMLRQALQAITGIINL